MRATRPRTHGLVLVPALALVLAACGGTGAQEASPSGAAPDTVTPAPALTPVPTPATDPGAGGGGVGDPGGGEPPLVDPGIEMVVPVPGLREPRAIDAETIELALDGDELVAQVTWSSGVSPCVSLARVDVVADGPAFTLTIVEGFGPPDIMCTAQVVRKGTVVRLGPAAAGTTYTARATGAPEEASLTVD